MTTAELLDAWRSASRAAELAERLVKAAVLAAERSERDLASLQELATLAEEAAASAGRAAATAVEVVRDAEDNLAVLRADLTDAQTTSEDAQAQVMSASDRLHRSEQEAES